LTASASDIVLVLTGGSGNSNPNLSIGGNPSATPVMGVLNNLFDNISETDSITGLTDYRCIYLFNNNSSNAFYNVKLYLDAIVGTDTNVTVGLNSTQEIQQIVIFGAVTGGIFTISYTDLLSLLPIVRTIDYHADPATWALNVQNALISDFPDIFVDVKGTFANRVFEITFPDFRNHDLFAIDTSGLTGSGIVGIVSKLTGGSPINAIPPLLDTSTTPPASVTFFSPEVSTPLLIGTIYPEEGFPIWFKRISAENTSPTAGVGFTLRILASPIESE